MEYINIIYIEFDLAVKCRLASVDDIVIGNSYDSQLLLSLASQESYYYSSQNNCHHGVRLALAVAFI